MLLVWDVLGSCDRQARILSWTGHSPCLLMSTATGVSWGVPDATVVDAHHDRLQKLDVWQEWI